MTRTTFHSRRVENAQADAKHRAYVKLANGGEMKCVICGCPHEEAFTFAHINGDGKEHREKLTTSIFNWINKTSIGEVSSKIQIECLYCNMYHAWNGHYPPVDQIPKWKP